MLHSCPITDHDNELTGQICKHPAVNRQIKCELCRAYDSFLPDILAQRCRQLEQEKRNVEILQKSDGKRHTNHSISGMEKDIKKGFKMLEGSLKEGRVRIEREKTHALFASNNVSEKCASLHYDPQNKLLNPIYDPSILTLTETNPNKILEAASLSLEKNPNDEGHAGIIRIFLRARRLYPHLFAKIATLLQHHLSKSDLDEQQCIFGIALFLDPLINYDYEKGLNYILVFDLLVHHNEQLRYLALKASSLSLMNQEHRDLLYKVLISNMYRLTREELAILDF